jgi:hypothetical protein
MGATAAPLSAIPHEIDPLLTFMGQEGADGSSPSEGLKNCDRHLVLSTLNRAKEGLRVSACPAI